MRPGKPWRTCGELALPIYMWIVLLLSIRAQQFLPAAGTVQLRMGGSAPLTTWGLEDATNSRLHMYRAFLLKRSPCCHGGLACATTVLGDWLNLRHVHHPRPSPHSPWVIFRWQSMSRPAVAAILADSASTAAGRLIPSRNGRRQHPPKSTARLQISDGERHI